MDEAFCEPRLRRSCLCPRESIIIGNHLWSRLPTPTETKCYETCSANGYDARVIDWNPFLIPQFQRDEPYYRKSAFQYLFDGKFCHCIKAQIDMHQYRPCTNELCKIICSNVHAECDKRTRRACFCHTHQLSMNLGRRTDPGELNCDIACRFGLFDAKILDIKWETTTIDSWGVRVSKYCTCTTETTAAGLTHCLSYDDQCPTYCGTPESYCTTDKYCYCGYKDNIMNNSMIRLGSGKEQDECGEKCRSWMWPVTEDNDAQPYIYDEALANCGETDTCPKIDTSPWKPDKAGTYSLPDLLEMKGDEGRKFCLCFKTNEVGDKPGNRFVMDMQPSKGLKKLPCFGNHTCDIVGRSLHIVS